MVHDYDDWLMLDTKAEQLRVLGEGVQHDSLQEFKLSSRRSGREQDDRRSTNKVCTGNRRAGYDPHRSGTSIGAASCWALVVAPCSSPVLPSPLVLSLWLKSPKLSGEVRFTCARTRTQIQSRTMPKRSLSPAPLPPTKRIHTATEDHPHAVLESRPFDTILSDEIVLFVFHYLSSSDLCAVQRTNRNWARLSLDNQVCTSIST